MKRFPAHFAGRPGKMAAELLKRFSLFLFGSRVQASDIATTCLHAMNTQALAETVLPSLPSILQALNENPLGAVVLVVLAAFAFAASARK